MRVAKHPLARSRYPSQQLATQPGILAINIYTDRRLQCSVSVLSPSRLGCAHSCLCSRSLHLAANPPWASIYGQIDGRGAASVVSLLSNRVDYRLGLSLSPIQHRPYPYADTLISTPYGCIDAHLWASRSSCVLKDSFLRSARGSRTSAPFSCSRFLKTRTAIFRRIAFLRAEFRGLLVCSSAPA